MLRYACLEDRPVRVDWKRRMRKMTERGGSSMGGWRSGWMDDVGLELRDQ